MAATVTYVLGGSPSTSERFPNRNAGSTFDAFEVKVLNADGSLKDLTGDTATITLRRTRGGAAAMAAVAHTGTPGVLGVFLFPPTGPQVASPDEYVATVDMVLDTKAEVGRFKLTIVPAT